MNISALCIDNTHQIDAAIGSGNLRVCFQPRVDLATHRVAGFAAKLCWHHPGRGMISPRKILNRIEHADSVSQLTSLAIDRSLAWLRATGGDPDWLLSLPVSVASLGWPELVAWLTRACERHAVAPERLVLELPDAEVINRAGIPQRVFSRLSLKGFGLSMADFVAGYSSLLHLTQLPYTDLNIGPPLMPVAAHTAKGRSILRTAVEMAGRLELRVTAEPVEDEKSFRFLAHIGCDMVQGRFIAPAMDAATASQWSRYVPLLEGNWLSR